MKRKFSSDQKFTPTTFAVVFAVIMLLIFFGKKADAQESAHPVSKISSTSPAPAKAIWSTSYDDAVKQAKATNRPIMLYFSGSDWCPWCKKQWHEVFQTEDFASWSQDRVILVVVDFPRTKTLPAEQSQKNFSLQNKFGEHLKSYPTTLFLNPKEEVIGKLGYKPDGKHGWMNRAQKFIAKNDQRT